MKKETKKIMSTFSIKHQKIILEPENLDEHKFLIEQLNIIKNNRIGEFITVKKPNSQII